MSSIFGGSKSTNRSSNQAYGTLNSALSPALGFVGQGGNALGALLGGDASGFNAYKSATGFDALSEMGSRGITGNAAARGLLRSGSTSGRLASFYNDIQNQYAGNYMQNLLGLGNLGLGAAGVLSDAGRTSESKGKSKNGLGGFLGGLMV